MSYYYVFLTGLFLNNFFSVNGCERSLEVRGVEDVCWTKNVEVIDRIQHTGKSVVNFAKKTIGLDVQEDKEPQKCEYYYCIFHELKLVRTSKMYTYHESPFVPPFQINEDDYPCYHRITNWIKNNVIYNHAMVLMPRVEACSSNTFFSTDVLDETLGSDETSASSALQSHCEVAAEYMKCMSAVEKNQSCPVFQYP